jgi:hypothetical protein
VPPNFELQRSDRPELDEQFIKETYGLDDEQIYWRRMTIANKCNGSIEIFQQEYPSTPLEAFIGTGRPVFDNVKLMKLKDTLPEPIARYECLTGLQQFISKDDGRLKVWEEPKRGESYVIGADIAEGLIKGDASSAMVVNHRTGKQVAEWTGKADADEMGVILMALGKRYNNAWLVVERNNHGLTTITVIVNSDYPYIYAEMVPEPPGKPRKRYGWLTNNATRPLILDNLVREVREDTHGIVSKELIEEMMSFKIQDNGKMEADVGRHDDRVLAFSIAKYARLVLNLPSMRNPSHHKTIKYSRGGRKPPVQGWT